MVNITLMNFELAILRQHPLSLVNSLHKLHPFLKFFHLYLKRQPTEVHTRNYGKIIQQINNKQFHFSVNSKCITAKQADSPGTIY